MNVGFSSRTGRIPATIALTMPIGSGDFNSNEHATSPTAKVPKRVVHAAPFWRPPA
jgi:hypothetical protein